VLTLRSYEKSDAGIIVGWTGDEIAFRKWCADRYDRWPITADDMNRNYDGFAGGFWPMTAMEDGVPFGHLIIRSVEGEKRTVRFGFVIVDPEKRGRGLGRELLLMALRYAFVELGAERVTLGVFENNPSARRCYLAAGFRELDSGGPEYFRIMGEKWRCIEMERLPDAPADTDAPPQNAKKAL